MLWSPGEGLVVLALPASIPSEGMQEDSSLQRLNGLGVPEKGNEQRTFSHDFILKSSPTQIKARRLTHFPYGLGQE